MTFLVPGGGRVASSVPHTELTGNIKRLDSGQCYKVTKLQPLSHISLLSRDINHTVSAVKWPLLIQRVKCIASRLHFLSVCLPWWRIMKAGHYGRRKGWTEDCHYLCLPHTPLPSQSRQWHFVADVIKWETTPHTFLFKAVWIVEYQWVILIFV